MRFISALIVHLGSRHEWRQHWLLKLTNTFPVDVKAGELPDIDGCYDKHMGICQDLSAVTIAMLRSQGVPARLMIGTLGSGTYHAWVTAIVNGEEKFFDPTVEVGAGSQNETYTTERYY